MADRNKVKEVDSSEVAVAKAKDFWTRYNKVIIGVCAVIIVAGGGWLIYRNFVVKPNEKKASESLFKAEEYFRADSISLALNGDGQYPGFLKVSSKFSGTDAGNLANFYAGVCYVRINDNDNAIKYLKKFSTSSKPTQARAYKLIADAYADKGNSKEALDYYKKSAHHFESDQVNSASALFAAAYLSSRVLKDSKQAIELFKELKEKFPTTEEGREADNYLAQLGVYNVN
jgi:tetratricopeptide (TPR) repeat protein